MSRPHTDAPDDMRRNGAAHALLVCPACGTSARRDDARFCATCGRAQGERAYLPADTLRASYHLQHRQPALIRPHTPHRSCILQQRMPTAMGWYPKSNQTTQRALVYLNYALVPYLGLLFCPSLIILGGVGLWRARYAPQQYGSARIAGRCVLLSLVIFGAQVFFWWLLYNVSPWARP